MARYVNHKFRHLFSHHQVLTASTIYALCGVTPAPIDLAQSSAWAVEMAAKVLRSR